MNELAELIHREIREDGAISFHRFMEMALYEPGLGYYETRRDIGRVGDFYTSVSVGKLFGELLGFQFAHWLVPLKGEVQLLEAGAHDGQLARDILDYLHDWQPEIYERTTLVLLESSRIHRQWQTETLANHEAKVKWRSEEPKPFRGVFYCNELFDAFPAQKLEWDAEAQSWFESGVGESDGQFQWRRMDEVKDSWNAGPELPDGSGMIHVPNLAPFWNGVCSSLREGRAVAIDYFLEEEEFFAPPRPHGTLRAYHQHQHSDDLLANVGEQDITVSVNLNELKFAAKASGAKGSEVSSQANFLVRIFEQTLEQPGHFPEWTPEKTRQFQTLIHPEHLGRAFKVLENWRKRVSS
jgi:SAM-dependent MidA family methyltransferase